jgi:hypothetical protein
VSGLYLWLKGDAGVTTTPETYVSQIIISGAGTTTSNGTYIRASGGLTRFNGSNGNYIYNDSGNGWALFDTQLYDPDSENYGHDSYYTDDFAYWYIAGANLGESPAPSGTTTNSSTGINLVTAWIDQSGNNITLTPINQNAPILVFSAINGKPCIEFTSSNNQGLNNATFSLGDFTIFFVAKQKSNNTGRIVSAYNDNVLIGTWSNGVDQPAYSNRFYGGESNGWIFEGTTQSTNAILNTAQFNASSYETLFRQNGTELAALTTSELINFSGLSVGGGEYFEGGSSEPSDSFFAELICYNAVLTSQQITQVEVYLNTKYAIY